MNVFPEYFKYDINAHDVDIFPLLTIGSTYDWRFYVPEDDDVLSPQLDTFFNPILRPFREYFLLSTTNLSAVVGNGYIPEWFSPLSDELKIQEFTPIISNISNLKESLDIEKGKHKISRFTVTLINAPYNGIRFSDAIGKLESFQTNDESGFSERLGKTLVGMDVQLHWASQSTIVVNSPGEAGNAFKTFAGIITKYEHSKKTVKLTIEDETSQRIVGKKFPKHNIGDGDDVPALYKNKPYPVVYGEVDNSPCVLKTEAVEGFDALGTPSPVVYCDRPFNPGTEDLSYSSFNFQDVGMSNDPALGDNSTALSFFDENAYSHILKRFIDSSPLTDQGGGVNGSLPVLYAPLEGNSYNQYSHNESRERAHKINFNSVPRNPVFFDSPSDDSSEEGSLFLSEGGIIVPSQTNVTDDVAFCYSIMYPISARLYQQGDDFSISGFNVMDLWDGSIDYNAQHFYDNTRGEEIILHQFAHDLVDLLGSSDSSGGFFTDFYSVLGIVNAYLADNNNTMHKNHVRIGFTMSSLPSNLAPLPFHLSFTGRIIYFCPSYNVDEFDGNTSEWNLGTDAYNQDTSSYNLNGVSASIIFGSAFGIDRSIETAPGYISLTPPYLTEGTYCSYPCVTPETTGGGFNEYFSTPLNNPFGETLNAMYDPVLSFEPSNGFWYNPGEQSSSNTGGENDPSGEHTRALFLAQIQKFSFFAQFYVTNFSEKQLYGNVLGRTWDLDNDGVFEEGGSYPSVPGIINDLLRSELWQDSSGSEYPWAEQTQIAAGNDEEYTYWKYGVTVHEEMEGQKFIEELLSVSPYMMKFNSSANSINYPVLKSSYSDEEIVEATVLDNNDIIDFSFSRTSLDDIYNKIIFKYKWDYGREVYLKRYEFDHTEATQLNDWGEKYDPNFYGKKFGERVLLIGEDDARGKYIRDDDTAENFVKWKFYQQCNQHLKIKIKLPLRYMNLETGDLIRFLDQIGDIDPYGIKYHINSSFQYADADGNLVPAPGDEINGQQAYNLFMINSISKGLRFVEIECTQLHNLHNGDYSRSGSIFGCMDETAWNYKPEATHSPNVTGGGCIHGGDFIVPADQHGCGLEVRPFPDPYSEAGDPNVPDYSTNYAGDGLNADEYFLDTQGNPLGWSEGVFVYLTSSDFNNITQPNTNGPAYVWWLNNGQPSNWTHPSAPRLYPYGNCQWADISQHNISRVFFLLRPNEEENWQPNNPSNDRFGAYLEGWNGFINFEIHDHLYDVDELTSPSVSITMSASEFKLLYLDEDNKANAKLVFQFAIHNWPIQDDFTYAGNNHLEVQLRTVIVGGSEGDILYDQDKYNFDISDSYRETSDASHGIRFYWIELNEFPLDFSEYILQSEDDSVDAEYFFQITYELKAQAEPDAFTELFRMPGGSGIHTPLYGGIITPPPVDEELASIMALGDASGDRNIDIYDVGITIYAMWVGLDLTIAENSLRYDVNQDGVVNTLDIMLQIETILGGPDDIYMYDWKTCIGDLFANGRPGGLQRYFDFSDWENAIENPCIPI